MPDIHLAVHLDANLFLGPGAPSEMDIIAAHLATYLAGELELTPLGCLAWTRIQLEDLEKNLRDGMDQYRKMVRR